MGINVVHARVTAPRRSTRGTELIGAIVALLAMAGGLFALAQIAGQERSVSRRRRR